MRFLISAWRQLLSPNGLFIKEPFVLWFTGLPGSGKTTLAEQLAATFRQSRFTVEHLDGDKIRTLFPQTGFIRSERDAHVRRVGYLASLLEKNGILVITSLISPYDDSRAFARNLCRRFIEVYLSTPLEECERRDPKGLYQKARRGEIQHFTGIDDPYEVPKNPEITLDTQGLSIEESVRCLIQQLKRFL